MSSSAGRTLSAVASLSASRFARLLPVLLPLALFTCSGVQGGATVVGPCPQVALEHDYDPVSDAVISWTIKPGEKVGQSFTVPEGLTSLTGFRVKLLRTGPAPRLVYRMGTRSGLEDIASGEFAAEEIPLFFERWVGKDLREPVTLRPGQRYYLQLEAGQGREPGEYELFGTASDEVDHRSFNRRYQYLPQWEQGSGDPGVFENPINVDYGTQTPRYAGGTAVLSNGNELPAVDFAFQFSSQSPPSSPAVPGEERFAFIQNQLLSPVHSPSIRVKEAPGKRPDEVAITPAWTLVSAPGMGMVARTAIADFRDFMRVSMGTEMQVQENIGAASGRQRVLAAGTRAHFPDLGKDLPGSESFALDVKADRVTLCGFDERGLMRGLHYLEDLLGLRGAPFLEIRQESRSPLYTPRITTSPFYSTQELEMTVDPYTDDFLSRISHFGFNAIWAWVDLFKIGHSDVYPELDYQVEVHQRNLRRMVERAGKYGIDVYVVLAYHPLPDSFFLRHPETRGTPFKAYGGDNVLCTSNETVRRYIGDSTADMFRKIPDLKGLVFIVGGEGFIHCHTRNLDCPRCSLRPPHEVIAELASVISQGARSARATADVALWPYSASNWWSRDDITQSKLIEILPREVTFMTEFGKEGLVTFGQKTIPAYDYPISYLGPSERFVEQARLTEQRGLPFWVKTEHAIALETIQTPYIPVFTRWAERFLRIHRFDHVTGLFANWMHYGFTPSIAAEVTKWHTWAPLPDSNQLLKGIARRNFGAGTEESALAAWRQWSDAIAHYPFSSRMAMGPVQKGPSHPLFIDPDYKPLHDRSRQFKNDLSWTEPWGVDVVITQLEQLVKGWQEGVDSWDRVIASSPAAFKPAAVREGGVGRALLACFRSTLNVARFYKVRAEIKQTTEPARALKLLDDLERVAREELENARQALPVIAADSRLGYANSAGSSSSGVPRGGIYSPGSIEKKIRQVEKLLNEQIPEYRSKLERQ